MKTLFVTLTLVSLSFTAQAMTKCVDADGRVVYKSGNACPPGYSSGAIQSDTFSSSGLRDGERRMLDRIEAREAEEQYYKREARRFERRHTLTFGDRKRIRELEMEKGQLSKSLTKGSKSWSQNMGIREQIRGIDRQIEQIRSPKY